MTAGASAYFSGPEHMLDPALFSAAGELDPGVRGQLLGPLYEFFRFEGIQAGSWLHAWLAGSGASYQWKASRGNGDLDVLLGIETVRFTQLNGHLAGLGISSRQDLAATLNEQMKKYLWPLTAATDIRGTVYEVTYYWNPEVSGDITVIRPYAAWNLITGTWDVHPDPEPRVSFPTEWYARAGENAVYVRRLYSQWTQHLADVMLLPAANPSRITAEAGLRRVTAELRSIWDTLHNGRRSAFAGGEGWGDIHNFFWQAAKRDGITGLLREVIAADDARQAEQDTRLYGAPIIPAELAYRRAATAAATRWLPGQQP